MPDRAGATPFSRPNVHRLRHVTLGSSFATLCRGPRRRRPAPRPHAGQACSAPTRAWPGAGALASLVRRDRGRHRPLPRPGWRSGPAFFPWAAACSSAWRPALLLEGLGGVRPPPPTRVAHQVPTDRITGGRCPRSSAWVWTWTGCRSPRRPSRPPRRRPHSEFLRASAAG